MLERAIENWLINTNERNYQVAFCQALICEGQDIIYNSRHGSLEHGKDIITKDKSGNINAYQLKTGDVNLSAWRNIKGEIEDLISIPVIHPSIDARIIHKSFLVLNGRISDEVRLLITILNEDNIRKDRKYSYLDVIELPALLKKFTEAQGKFIPVEPADFEMFLKYYLADGRDLFKKPIFFDFIEKAIFKGKAKSDIINSISSSVILTSYLLNNFQKCNNHFAIYETWTSLGALIIRYAFISGLGDNDYKDSLGLVFLEIVNSLESLKSDFLSRKDYLEGDVRLDGALMYNIRIVITMGAISALENYKNKNKKDYVKDNVFVALIETNIEKLEYWGEYAFPFLYSIIRYLELNNKSELAQKIIENMLDEVLNSNDIDSKVGLSNPYYGPTEVLESVLKLGNKTDMECFTGGSYTLEMIVMIIVKRNLRAILENNWMEISHMQYKEFVPDNVEDLFLWRIEKGTNCSKFPIETQSWNELINSVNISSDIHDILKSNIDMLKYFVLVCPHRMNTAIIRLFENIA